MNKDSNARDQKGAIAAEYMAAIVFLFLVLTFPLVNLATITYKYNMVVNAVHNAAHYATTAPNFTNATTGVKGIVTQALNRELGSLRGITLNRIDYRINHVNVATSAITHEPWKTKLANQADQNEQYSIEVVVEATCQPLLPLSTTGFIPAAPGLTAPAHYTVASQELIENVQGLNL